MEQEPNDIIIMSAISSGATRFGKIVKKTKIEEDQLGKLLDRLIDRGFVQMVEKKGLFGTKKEITLTEKGNKELEERKFELEQNWNQMVTMWKSEDKQKLQQYMNDNHSILPSMMYLGIIDLMMFSTMMSFAGLAMTNFIPENYMQDTDSSDIGHDTGHDSGDSSNMGDFHGDGGTGDMGGFDVNF